MSVSHADDLRKICAQSFDRRSKSESHGSVQGQLCADDLSFLDNVITGDESWVFEYDPELSAEWHTMTSLRQKKARMS